MKNLKSSPFCVSFQTEEILHTHVAHWWSPDGERLAFLVLNDSLVPNMALPRFTGMAYPKGKQYPYPKVNSEKPYGTCHDVTVESKLTYLANVKYKLSVAFLLLQ